MSCVLCRSLFGLDLVTLLCVSARLWPVSVAIKYPPPPPALEGMMTVPRYELLGLTELLVSVCGGPEMLIPAHSLAIGVFLPSLV